METSRLKLFLDSSHVLPLVNSNVYPLAVMNSNHENCSFQ